MEKFAGCTIELDINSDEQGTICVPGLTNEEAEAALLLALEGSLDALGSVPVELPTPIEHTYEPVIPAEVIEAEEERCDALQYALQYKEANKKRLTPYLMYKGARQAAIDAVNRNKEIFARLTPAQKRKHSQGFRDAQSSQWDKFHAAKEKCRQAYEEYTNHKALASLDEADAWDQYFAKAEELAPIIEPYSFQIAALRHVEFNRFNTTGYGSEIHDLAWAKGDIDDPSSRVQDEFEQHCAYWGSNRNWLPAKDRRAAFRAVRSEQNSQDQEAFEALMAELD